MGQNGTRVEQHQPQRADQPPLEDLSPARACS